MSAESNRHNAAIVYTAYANKADLPVPERVARFAHCTSGCQTGGHQSWGECARAKGVSTGAGETTRPSFPITHTKPPQGAS